MRFAVRSLFDLIVLHSSVGSPTGVNVARVLGGGGGGGETESPQADGSKCNFLNFPHDFPHRLARVVAVWNSMVWFSIATYSIVEYGIVQHYRIVQDSKVNY